jgi:hypothetical protein
MRPPVKFRGIKFVVLRRLDLICTTTVFRLSALAEPPSERLRRVGWTLVAFDTPTRPPRARHLPSHSGGLGTSGIVTLT